MKREMILVSTCSLCLWFEDNYCVRRFFWCFPCWFETKRLVGRPHRSHRRVFALGSPREAVDEWFWPDPTLGAIISFSLIGETSPVGLG